MEKQLKKLNKEQKEAVKTVDGPLLVMAGAGSGKTRVLTTRIAYLIKEKNVDPKNILAITFTNKAAREMKERVRDLIGEETKDMQISTFHSFGLKIIKENYEKLKYKSNFTIIDADDSKKEINKLIKDNNLKEVLNPKTVKNKISSLKNDLVRVNDYKKIAYTYEEEQILKIYEEYEKDLKRCNTLDFDDLLLLPYYLFKKDKEVLKRYQDQYKYILIDEYQDTNEAQYRLVKLLAEKNRNICVVGDSDQSIYAFRGANYKNILNFTKDFKEAKVVKLEQNYRSTNNILNIANKVIAFNQERSEKELWSDLGEGENVEFYLANDEIDEAKDVNKKIRELVEAGSKRSEIAVIYRTNAQSRIFEEIFNYNNVPYALFGSLSFYAKKEIKDVIAYLKLIINPDDDISFERIVNVPNRGIGAKTYGDIVKEAEEKNTSLFDSIEDGKALEFKKIILDLMKIKDDLSISEFLKELYERIDLLEYYGRDKTVDSNIRVENLKELINSAVMFELSGYKTIEEFLDSVSLTIELNSDEESDRINLMTVHSVKGLEFDNVFVVGLEEDLFPHIMSKDSKSELEEERRLFYVAVTRARKKLFLSAAKERYVFGKKSSHLPSRFLEESGIVIEEKPKRVRNNYVEKDKKIDIDAQYKDEEVNFNQGDLVYHKIFGKGKVLNIDGEYVEIAFNQKYGIKKLMKNHKSISKM